MEQSNSNKVVNTHNLPYTMQCFNEQYPPCPIRAPVRASFAVPKPSSRHTTLAAFMSQLSSHTVPQMPFFSTSTRPSPTFAPPRRRTRGCQREIKQRKEKRLELKTENKVVVLVVVVFVVKKQKTDHVQCNKLILMTVHPPFTYTTYPLRVSGKLEPIPVR